VWELVQRIVSWQFRILNVDVAERPLSLGERRRNQLAHLLLWRADREVNN
jgi:hypothetical protein